MKRTFLFLLVLALFLTGCNFNEKDTQNTKKNTAFYLESLPEIGEFSGKTQGGRFYEDITYDFVPGDEYGKIIPYVGSYRFYETPKDNSWYTKMGYATYGFCTLDGRIVMDASEKNTFVNHIQTEDGFGFYTVHREERQKEDAPDEFLPSETLVIPDSGKWFLSLKSNSYVVNSGGGHISIVEYPGDSGEQRVHLYDYDGKLVRTIEGTDSTGSYSQGLMLVSSYVKGGYRAEFVDEQGQKVLGPYKSASDFNENGITAVSDENGAYIVNAEGERLTEYYKDFFKEFSLNMKKHVFVGRRLDNNKELDVYSDKAEYLGKVEGATYASFRFCDNGEILYYYTKFDTDEKGHSVYNSEKIVWKRLSDNSDFVNEELGVSPNSYSGTDNCFVYEDKENSRAVLLDENASVIAEIEGATQVVNSTEHGEYVIFITGEYDYRIDEQTGKPVKDTRKTHIYDSKNKKIIYSMDHAGTNAHFADRGKRFIMITVYNSDPDNMFSSLSRSWLFDTQSGKIVFEDCSQISLYDVGEETYINVCTDNSTALYDENLALVRKLYFE